MITHTPVIVKKIDAHIHFFASHTDCVNRLRELDIKLLNICVADFLTKYRDRILYGSDFVDYRDQSALSREDRHGVIEKLTNAYPCEMNYLTSNRTVEYRGRSFTGPSLSEEVAKKLFYDNAHRWYAIE